MILKLPIIITSLFLLASNASAQQSNIGNMWKTPCNSKAIKKEFQVNDPTPFEFKGNCSTAISNNYFDLINEGEKYERDFLDKIEPRCFEYSSGPINRQDKVVCINNELAAYEIDYKGDKAELFKNLNSKYGPIKKTGTDTWGGSAYTYSLFSNISESYVILVGSPVFSTVEGKTITDYSIMYINPAAYKRWNEKYLSIIEAEKSLDKAKKKEATQESLSKLR